jgi:hypothetical protein
LLFTACDWESFQESLRLLNRIKAFVSLDDERPGEEPPKDLSEVKVKVKKPPKKKGKLKISIS